MSPNEVLSHLRREPFQPIQICMSDGSIYEVPHPEFALVTRSTVAIALKLSEGELPDHMVYCDPLHITRILPLTNGAAKAHGKNST